MSERVALSGPVDIQSDSRHRVALDLAVKIVEHGEGSVKYDRAFWLKLYAQCLKVVNGSSAEVALKENK